MRVRSIGCFACLCDPYSGRIGGVSVACTWRVTDRQQTRRDVRVAMALDGLRTIRRPMPRHPDVFSRIAFENK